MPLFLLGTNGCWTRVDSGSSRLEPLGAFQHLKLDNVIYQEAGEYRCIASSKETTKRMDSLRSAMSVHLSVTGKRLKSMSYCENYKYYYNYGNNRIHSLTI